MSNKEQTFEQLRQAASLAIADAVRLHAVFVDKLTEHQVISALKQAIASGDFLRHVRVTDNAQAVDYVPFREKERLEAEIAKLKKAGQAVVDNLYRDHESKLYDAVKDWEELTKA